MSDSEVITIITNGRVRTIPANEPVFLIRAQDIAGAATVRAWAELATAYGASREIVRAARDIADAMDQWPKKKVPDLPKVAPIKHAIYELRDGRIVDRCGLADRQISADVVREIVAGPEWMPWNGGVAPAIDHRFLTVVRRNPSATSQVTSDDMGWVHTGGPDDILAYNDGIPF